MKRLEMCYSEFAKSKSKQFSGAIFEKHDQCKDRAHEPEMYKDIPYNKYLPESLKPFFAKWHIQDSTPIGSRASVSERVYRPAENVMPKPTMQVRPPPNPLEGINLYSPKFQHPPGNTLMKQNLDQMKYWMPPTPEITPVQQPRPTIEPRPTLEPKATSEQSPISEPVIIPRAPLPPKAITLQPPHHARSHARSRESLPPMAQNPNNPTYHNRPIIPKAPSEIKTQQQQTQIVKQQVQQQQLQQVWKESCHGKQCYMVTPEEASSAKNSKSVRIPGPRNALHSNRIISTGRSHAAEELPVWDEAVLHDASFWINGSKIEFEDLKDRMEKRKVDLKFVY